MVRYHAGALSEVSVLILAQQWHIGTQDVRCVLDSCCETSFQPEGGVLSVTLELALFAELWEFRPSWSYPQGDWVGCTRGWCSFIHACCCCWVHLFRWSSSASISKVSRPLETEASGRVSIFDSLLWNDVWTGSVVDVPDYSTLWRCWTRKNEPNKRG